MMFNLYSIYLFIYLYYLIIIS